MLTKLLVKILSSMQDSLIRKNITISYVSANEEMGTVTPASENLLSLSGEAKGSTATAKPGYKFVNWTDSTGNIVSNDAYFRPQKVNGKNVEATYTANFTVNAFAYQVKHVYRDANNKVVETLTTTEDDKKKDYLSAISESPRDPETAQGNFILSNVVLSSTDKTTLTITDAGNVTGTMPAENLTITFYYDADNIGETNPEEGDGIADKFQITVTYKAINGTITSNAGPFVLTKL